MATSKLAPNHATLCSRAGRVGRTARLQRFHQPPAPSDLGCLVTEPWGVKISKRRGQANRPPNRNATSHGQTSRGRKRERRAKIIAAEGENYRPPINWQRRQKLWKFVPSLSSYGICRHCKKCRANILRQLLSLYPMELMKGFTKST